MKLQILLYPPNAAAVTSILVYLSLLKDSAAALQSITSTGASRTAEDGKKGTKGRGN